MTDHKRQLCKNFCTEKYAINQEKSFKTLQMAVLKRIK